MWADDPPNGSSRNTILSDVGHFRQPELRTSAEYRTVSAAEKFTNI